MANRFALSLASLSLLTLSALAVPQIARAQDPPADTEATAGEKLNYPVTLETKNATLYDVLALLFKQAHAQSALDINLKQIAAPDLNISKKALRVVLGIVLRGTNYTYKDEGGIYTVNLKVDAPIDVPVTAEDKPATDTNRLRIFKINPANFNSTYIVMLLGGKVIPTGRGSQGGGQGGGFGGGGLGQGGGGGFGGGGGGFGGGGQGGGGFGGGGGGFGGGGGGGGFGGGGGRGGGGGGRGGGGGF